MTIHMLKSWYTLCIKHWTKSRIAIYGHSSNCLASTHLFPPLSILSHQLSPCHTEGTCMGMERPLVPSRPEKIKGSMAPSISGKLTCNATCPSQMKTWITSSQQKQGKLNLLEPLVVVLVRKYSWISSWLWHGDVFQIRRNTHSCAAECIPKKILRIAASHYNPQDRTYSTKKVQWIHGSLKYAWNSSNFSTIKVSILWTEIIPPLPSWHDNAMLSSPGQDGVPVDCSATRWRTGKPRAHWPWQSLNVRIVITVSRKFIFVYLSCPKTVWL